MADIPQPSTERAAKGIDASGPSTADMLEAETPGGSGAAVPRLQHLAAFYLAFILAAGFGQWLAIIPGISITLWPPSGVFIAVLLVNRRASWPWWIAAGCLAELTCNVLWFHNSIHLAAMYFAANALEAMTGAWLLGRYFGRPVRIETLRQVIALVALGVGIAPMVAATVGSSIDAVIGKHAFATAWMFWWLGDATGVLIAAPLTLVAIEAWRDRSRLPAESLAEIGALGICLAVLTAIALGGNLPFAYIVVPPLLWAAVRFEIKGAAIAVAGVALLVAVFTATGISQFAGDPATQKYKYVMMQLFLALSALTSLVVAAIAREHRLALLTLKASNDTLETRVAERTAELQESEQRLEAALHAGKLGVHDFDPLTGRIRWDASVYRLWGIPEGEPVTLEVFESGIHPDDLAAVRGAVRAALDPKGNGRFEAEYRVVNRADKSVRWVFTDGEATFENGVPVRLVGTVQDISERREAQAAVAHLAAIVTSSSDAIVSKTLDGTITSWNAAAEKMLGYRADEIVGRSIRELIPPERQAEEDAILARVAAGEPTSAHETVRMHKSGRPVDVSVAVSPLRTGGRIVGASTIIRDITERRQQELALAIAAERAEVAQQAARAALYEYVPATNAVVRTGSTADVVGYGPDELPPTGEGWRELIHPDDVERIWREISEGIASGRGYGIEYRVRHKDGHHVWLHDRARVLKGRGAEPDRVVGMVLDISEQKEREEQAQFLMREVNHRSKNILGLVQAIARQTAAGNAQDFARRFSERIIALSASQDLLVKNAWKGVPLPDLVRSQLAHFADLIDARIALEGPRLVVTAAAAQTIGMAIHELATNAGKYGALSNATGLVRITWTLRAASESARFAMSWAEQGGPPVEKPARQGFGSTVISTVARTALSADVNVAYAPTGFAWTLECDASKVLESSRPAGAPWTPAEPDAMQRATGRGSVLVVEDDALIAMEIVEAVSKAGFDVLGPASTVQQALELLAGAGCDAAVLDVNLGRETSEPVALRLSRRGTPFVTVSGYAEDQQPDVFRAAPFVGKPLRPEKLVAELKRAIAAA